MLKRIFGRLHSKKQTTTNSTIRDSEIDRYLDELNRKDMKTISILLLGIGGCGKSTILKQMEKIYRPSISNKILKDATIYIKQNILEDIYDLSIQNKILKNECNYNRRNLYLSALISNDYLNTISIDLNIFIPSEIMQIINNYYCYCPVELSQESQIICTQIASIKCGELEDTQLTPDFAKQISILWNDKGLQETFNIRKRQCIMSNTPYLFENIDKISKPEYIADFDDYVRIRHRTTGIIEVEMDVHIDSNITNQWRMKVTDIGGMRTERKKWLRCFTDIHAIYYVMALDGYDKTLFEDHTQNCYQESLDLFERVMKHEALATIDCIVFLNKNDIFIPKIRKIPFTVFDPNFDKDLVHNADAVKDYLRREYKKRFYDGINPNKSLRRIHFHVSCALDTDQLQKVMHLIQFKTVRKPMTVGMLM